MGEFGAEKNLQKTSKVGNLEGNSCFICILKNEMPVCQTNTENI